MERLRQSSKSLLSDNRRDGTSNERDGNPGHSRDSQPHKYEGLPSATFQETQLAPQKELHSYQPVLPEQIRLLKIQPPASKSVIGELVTVSIQDHPEYIALSYCWGDGSEEKIIYVPGAKPVTSSLFQAIHHIRDLEHDKIFMVWADAICIDQLNNEEKAEQIALMPQIYSKASKVILYTGEYADGSEHVVPLIQWIQSPTPDSGAPDPNHECWEAFCRFLSRKYFRRLWIMQEIAFASSDPQILVGKSVCMWSHLAEAVQEAKERQFPGFETAFQKLTTSHGPHNIAAALIASIHKIRKAIARGESVSLARLLPHCRFSLCTLQIDRLYGLLGLSAEAHCPELMPNYNESEDQTLLRYATFFVQTGKVLNILGRYEFPSPYNTPSWVPEWLDSSKISARGRLRSRNAGDGFRCNEEAVKAHVNVTNSVLVMQGYIFDPIEHTGLCIERWTPQSRNEPVALTQLLDMAEQATCYGDATERELAIAKTLICDGIQVGPENLLTRYRHFRHLCCTGDNPKSLETFALKEFTEYNAWVMSIGMKMRPMISKMGFIGQVPKEAKGGDVIAVFCGAETPFVLRETSNGYRFLGWCFVQGIMYGEAASMGMGAAQSIHII